MFTKEEICFPVEQCVELSAWLFTPVQRNGLLPAITMAHGYGATRYHGIEAFAEAFANAGFAVLLHDHRGFGDSSGEPRHDINPWQQVTDWRSAISYLQDRPEVDAHRIGLWGTCFAGGHAIVLGATDRRLKAIVSQVPTVDGHQAGMRRVTPDAVAALEASFAADDRAQLRGEPPAYEEMVSETAAKPSRYSAEDVVSFYLRPVPYGVWENRITVRSTRWLRMYSPGDFIDRVSPTPLLMVIAERDHTTLTDLALKAYERALAPKKLRFIKGGHFDPYVGAFPIASRAAVEWFTEHL